MKLAIASCIKIQDTPSQPVWQQIQAEQPDALLLLGDTVYLDHNHHNDPAALRDELLALYAAQCAEPHFAALLQDLQARGGQLMAIYDDHDFMGNNRYGGDHSPALRQAARDAFVQTFAPARTGSDIYHLYRLGRVDVALLDARFYRQCPAVSSSDRDAVLGPAQWAWLEQAVQASQAPYFAVASSTTFHTFGDESWEQYPAAFARLAGLLRQRTGALVLSGDVHRNAVYDDSGVIEIVCSAVARKGLLWGSVRQNYGLLSFDEQQLQVALRSLKVGWRFDFAIQLSHWALP